MKAATSAGAGSTRSQAGLTLVSGAATTRDFSGDFEGQSGVCAGHVYGSEGQSFALQINGLSTL